MQPGDADFLKGIDAAGTPPCELFLPAKGDEEPPLCGKPSTSRVTVSCCYERRMFACVECLYKLKQKLAKCRACDAISEVSWRET